MTIDYDKRARARLKLAKNILDDKRPTYGMTPEEKTVIAMDQLEAGNRLLRQAKSDQWLAVQETFLSSPTQEERQ